MGDIVTANVLLKPTVHRSHFGCGQISAPSQWTMKYMADWDASVAASKNAAEMRAKVLA